MWLLLWFPLLILIAVLFLVRKISVDALSAIVTREPDTYRNVQLVLRCLGANVNRVTFVSSKDRSSYLFQGASRRKGKRVTAMQLEARRKRDEKLSEIRKNLAAKLNFKTK